MSTTIETLYKITAAVVGGNAIKEFANNINTASTGSQKFARSLNQGAMALKAFAFSEAVQGLKGLVQGAINTGAEIYDVSQKTGVAVEALGRLKGAAEQSGLSLETTAKSLVKLNQSILAGGDTTSKQAQAFAQLGITAADLKGKKTEEIFYKIADGFAQSEDGAAKASVAIALFGKSGADMIPMLNKGSEEIKSLGIAIGSDFAARADQFNDNMDLIKMQFEQLTVDVAGKLLPGMVRMSEGFNQNNVAIKTLVGTVKLLETSFVGLGFLGSTITDAIGEKFALLTVKALGLYEKMKAIVTLNWGDLGTISDSFATQEQSIRDESRFNSASAKQGAKNTLDAIWNERLGQGAAATGSTILGGEGKNKLAGVTDEAAGAASKAAKEFEAAAKAADEWLLKQRESITTLRQESSYIGLTTIEVKKLKDAREIESQVAEKAKNMTEAQATAFRAQAAEIQKTRQAVLQYNYDQSRTFGAGAKQFFADYAESVTDTASQVKDVLQGAFKGAEDALVEFTTTGKFNFKGFATSIISDLARIQIQRSVLGPLSNMLGSFFGGGGETINWNSPRVAGFALGGIMTNGGPLPLNKYANGGVANSPQLAMFGEGRMPEAYVPLPDGRSIPVTMKGGSGDVGAISVNVTINNDGTREDTQSQSERGAQLGRSIVAAVRAQLIEEKRPGGLLA